MPWYVVPGRSSPSISRTTSSGTPWNSTSIGPRARATGVVGMPDVGAVGSPDGGPCVHWDGGEAGAPVEGGVALASPLLPPPELKSAAVAPIKIAPARAAPPIQSIGRPG